MAVDFDEQEKEQKKAKKHYQELVNEAQIKNYEQIKFWIAKYMEMPLSDIRLVAFWCFGTYFHQGFETYPILHILAQKRSGKTRLLKLLSALSANSSGATMTSCTEAVLFRNEGSLFIDEVESINSKEKQALRETINCIYKKGNQVTRWDSKEITKEGGEKRRKDVFSPYYPLALASINDVGSVLSDRAIQIILKRATNKKTLLIENFEKDKKIIELKEALSGMHTDLPENLIERWNSFVEDELKDDELTPLFEKIEKTGVNGRTAELFLPLMVLAYMVGEEEEFLVEVAGYVKTREEEDKEDMDERFKSFIDGVGLVGWVACSEIRIKFMEWLEEDLPYVTPRTIASIIKRLSLPCEKRRLKGKTLYLFNTTPTTPTTPTTLPTLLTPTTPPTPTKQ